MHCGLISRRFLRSGKAVYLAWLFDGGVYGIAPTDLSPSIIMPHMTENRRRFYW
jgi:hypothetical protein